MIRQVRAPEFEYPSQNTASSRQKWLAQRSLSPQHSNDRKGRLCRCLDYVEPPWASCANRPAGAAGADLDLHIIRAFAGSRSASRVPCSA